MILDLQLLEMKSDEICQELRKLDDFKISPITVVTAFAMKEDKK